MNLDERIEEIVRKHNWEPTNFRHIRELNNEGAVEAFKQLLRDVLEYVKPEYNPTHPDYNFNFEKCLNEMEAKIKELGL